MTANRIPAPKCTRWLALVALVLSGLWIVLYVLGVVFQRQYMFLYASSPELLGSFIVPLSPLLSNLALCVLQAILCILLLTSGQKAIWSKGRSAGMIVAEAGLLLLSGILNMVLPILENKLYAQYGATTLASYSVVSSTVSRVSGIMTASAICTLIALSIIAYQTAHSQTESR